MPQQPGQRTTDYGGFDPTKPFTFEDGFDPAKPFTFETDKPTDPKPATPIKDYLWEATASFNPVRLLQSLQDAAGAEWDAIKAGVKGNPTPFMKSRADAASPIGRLSFDLADALSKGEFAKVPQMLGDLSYLPVVGPRLKEAQGAFEAGETAKGLGILTDVGLSVAGPGGAAKLPKKATLPRPLLKPPVGAAGEAVAAFEAAGGSPSLATAAGSKMARVPEVAAAHSSFMGAEHTNAMRVQEAADLGKWRDVLVDRAAPGTGTLTAETVGDMVLGKLDTVREGIKAGEAVEDAAAAAKRAATGQSIADSVYPSPQTRYQAGTTATKQSRQKMQSLDQIADENYGLVRMAEEQVENQQRSGGAGAMQPAMMDGRPLLRDGKPIMVPGPPGPEKVVGLPVNLAAGREPLRGIFERFKAETEARGGVPPSGAAGRAFDALGRIFAADETVSLSVADRMLSDLKSTVRKADSPLTRNVEQGVSAAAVRALEVEVQRAAAKAGPEVVKALQAGRDATKAKYAISDVLKNLERGAGDSPVRVANKLAQPGDVNIHLLQQVQKHAPDAIPQLGRALVDRWLELPPEKALKEFQALGPQSRSLLYDAGKQQALSDFLRPGPGGRPSAAAVFKDLPTDPLTVLSSVTQKGDAAIGKLDTLISLIGPQSTRQLGRALVEDLSQKLLGGGGALDPKEVAKITSQWRDIGPKTKQRLFQDPALVRELDHFFTMGDRLSSAPPSGGNFATAAASISHVGTLSLTSLLRGPLDAMTAFGIQEAGGLFLAKALNNRKTVKALTQALTVNPSAAATTAAYANLARVYAETYPQEGSPDGRR